MYLHAVRWLVCTKLSEFNNSLIDAMFVRVVTAIRRYESIGPTIGRLPDDFYELSVYCNTDCM